MLAAKFRILEADFAVTAHVFVLAAVAHKGLEVVHIRRYHIRLAAVFFLMKAHNGVPRHCAGIPAHLVNVVEFLENRIYERAQGHYAEAVHRPENQMFQFKRAVLLLLGHHLVDMGGYQVVKGLLHSQTEHIILFSCG